jgi:copper transporter 1
MSNVVRLKIKSICRTGHENKYRLFALVMVLTVNRYTVDACFLSRSWHVTSNGMFAGSCIGVILLVLALEFLRRLGKEYDRKILREHQQKFKSLPESPHSSTSSGSGKNVSGVVSKAFRGGNATMFRPSIAQQAIRAALHMLAFAVAYFVMLLAM